MKIKRKKYSTVTKYINKLEDAVHPRENNWSRECRENPNKSMTSYEEDFYVSLFVRHCSPADMRRYLNNQEPMTLREAYKIARKFEQDDSDAESSSEGDSSADDTDTQSDSDSNSHSKGESSRNKSNSKARSVITRPPLPSKIQGKEQDLQSALMLALEQNQQLLLIQQQGA
ncbi:hypothetical protein BDF20DRAFT_876323 [Mycotypha africana]|uniref:uncharacterized protein n=1 Tax=Mycotypha africana TaxID=64632 RepID=UPI002301923A|nr:uncharacterized protein BDF20DRAFT_876210 [Mycotypha africana]XP_052935971.1 uncharacterized protein BDF20DRAFT_876323 [Mycotypha africana]KAI8977665.1 hypothetical protein BDF20DRAFT_876210 [Mycotypha africana]KAI8977687.1 hypothetical protein BDF20DRAFT_876323 [Mycotypha africana]